MATTKRLPSGSPRGSSAIGESLMVGAVRVLDMGSSDLESLVIHRPDETVDLLIFDPMPGGSGLLDQTGCTNRPRLPSIWTG
jgi:hypothetical protein